MAGHAMMHLQPQSSPQNHPIGPSFWGLVDDLGHLTVRLCKAAILP